MNLKEAVVHVFQNYANFNGRARRSEYWYFHLFDLIVPTIVSIVTLLPGLISGDATLLVIFGLGKILLAVYGLAGSDVSAFARCWKTWFIYVLLFTAYCGNNSNSGLGIPRW